MQGLPTLYLIHAHDKTRNIPLPDGAPIPRNTSIELFIKNTSDATVSAEVSTRIKQKKGVNNPCTKKIASTNIRSFSFSPLEDCTLNDFVMRAVDNVSENLKNRKRDREETDSSKQQQEREVKRRVSDSNNPVLSIEEKEKESERVSFGRRRFNDLANTETQAMVNEEYEKEKEVPKTIQRPFLAQMLPQVFKDPMLPQVFRDPMLPQVFQRFASQAINQDKVQGEQVRTNEETIRSNEINNESIPRFNALVRFVDTQTERPVSVGNDLVAGREVGFEVFNPSDRPMTVLGYIKRLDDSRVDPQFNKMKTIDEKKACRLFTFTPNKEDGILIIDLGFTSFNNTNMTFHTRLSVNVK
ncbi:hypothetical protein [Criblamydia sequanensis]|uniref:Uncharacterized protein n=1 Tax=Candidatus Criblamydia sequanensis CRIB-18 TaxID=1437425 RepID=A0A090D0P8_9BACT|nr:hypothetical protein [Criblamydia sequanensis]CDR34901.1 hypothetical protein CSEC_2095 [Criblamydia sequanensis CRIB-18]